LGGKVQQCKIVRPVARMGEMRNTDKILVENVERKRLLGRQRHRGEDSKLKCTGWLRGDHICSFWLRRTIWTKTVTPLIRNRYETGSVPMNVTWRRGRVTIVAVEKQ
jgi:hypothetical protein